MMEKSILPAISIGRLGEPDEIARVLGPFVLWHARSIERIEIGPERMVRAPIFTLASGNTRLHLH
ncbi:MAG: hypothetical protein WB822_06360 [Rhodoplanes sp.]